MSAIPTRPGFRLVGIDATGAPVYEEATVSDPRCADCEEGYCDDCALTFYPEGCCCGNVRPPLVLPIFCDWGDE